MKRLGWCIILLLFAAQVFRTASSAEPAGQGPPQHGSRPVRAEPEVLCAEEDKNVAILITPYIEQAQQRVEQFFGQPFEHAFVVEITPDRAAFDDYFKKRWQIPKTEAWMVASGVAAHLTILSPRVWKTQAVEHNPDDLEHIRELLAHEVVHVFHGQHNPRPDFDGMDDCAWFVEGLAVYVSGQLKRSHGNAAADAVKAGAAPARLGDAWSGPYRYGVCGSLVDFVDRQYGRDVLKRLLSVVNNKEALTLLHTTESEFLGAWRNYVANQR